MFILGNCLNIFRIKLGGKGNWRRVYYVDGERGSGYVFGGMCLVVKFCVF